MNKQEDCLAVFKDPLQDILNYLESTWLLWTRWTTRRVFRISTRRFSRRSTAPRPFGTATAAVTAAIRTPKSEATGFCQNPD
eukprot:487316-Ditylum_brightwellii.AAC.1